MNNSLEKIREAENNEIAKHLFEIEAIAKQKSIGSGIDKIIGELILHGIGQFSLADGFRSIELIGYDKPHHKFSPQIIERTKDVIHKENKDIVRHLIGIENVINKKCSRCDGNCMGCCFDWFDGIFNIEPGMRIIYLYDWKAISEIVKFKPYAHMYTVYDFVNTLGNKSYREKNIEMYDTNLETNYLQTGVL